MVAGERASRRIRAVHPRRETDDEKRRTEVAKRRNWRGVIGGFRCANAAQKLAQARTPLAVCFEGPVRVAVVGCHGLYTVHAALGSASIRRHQTTPLPATGDVCHAQSVA